MEKRKSFAAVVTGKPYIPPPLATPSSWETYLLQELRKLQDELSFVKADLAIKEEKLILLEAKLQVNNTQQQQMIKEEDHEADTTQQDIKTPAQVNNQLVAEVISTIKEQDKMQENKKIIRIGGLSDDWTQAEIKEEEYKTETDIWKEKLVQAVPFVDLGDPIYIRVKGKQAVVSYDTLEEKRTVMKQTRSLKGTKVWIQDELTPLQLKNRSNELARVRAARKEGKWAVYREGKALIREFKNPIPKEET